MSTPDLANSDASIGERRTHTLGDGTTLATEVTLYSDLNPGDTIVVDRYEGAVAAEVISRDGGTITDVLGRQFPTILARRLDTGATGQMPYGPTGVADRKIP